MGTANEKMRRFWVRWFGGDDGDPRPLTFPVPIEWWCSGEDAKGTCTICAIVDAVDEDAVWAEVRKYWPEAVQSFCEETEPSWRPDPGRFPDQRSGAPT